MKITLAEPKLFTDSMAIISDLVNEARFKVTADSIELVAMDPANVAMVVFKLLSSACTEYAVPKDTELAINLANLRQVLRRVGPTDVLQLSLSSNNQLSIEIRGKTKRTFLLPLIDIEEKQQKVPELTFPVTITTKSAFLTETIEDAGIVADAVSLTAEEDRLLIDAEGDLSRAKIEMKADDDTKIMMTKSDKVRSKYSVEYLKKMIAGSKLADSVSLMFNKDYPLKLEYKAVDKLIMTFILAPRVEND